MLRSDVFSRATAWVELVAGFFMIIPSTAGTLGLVFSLVSLIPWLGFLVMISRQFMKLGNGFRPSQ